MDLVIFLLFLALLGQLSYTLLLVRRGDRAIAEARERLAELGAGEPAVAAARPGLEVVISLDDPIAVAEQESPRAGLVTGIAPALVTREVYRQVRDESVALLAQRGIEADVAVRVAWRRTPA